MATAAPKYESAAYARCRPRYPDHWFSMLSSLTAEHRVAWDAGTGNDQAAVAVAEHYNQVIATDADDEQLRQAIQHPKVRYLHTPPSMSEDEMVALLGGEGSVDLVTVATAVHWFDLPRFYAVVRRVLKNPGGVIAVWGYNHEISPLEGPMARFYAAIYPYNDQRADVNFDRYRRLPFPFDGVGLGVEGAPANLDMPVEASFEGFLAMLRTWSPVVTAREQGVDLLPPETVDEMAEAWGDTSAVRTLTFKAFMLAGASRPEVPRSS